jgi:hypothetical protein
MQQNAIFDRVQKSPDILKGIGFDSINKLAHNVNESEKRTFGHSLKLAAALHRANEYFTSKEGRTERDRLGMGDVPKHEFFNALFGFAKAHTFRLISVGKLQATAPDVVTAYLDSDGPLSLIGLVKFAKVSDSDGDGDGDVNTTATAPTERSTKEKPAKYTTGGKGIEIKINSGVTAQDVADAIAYLQSLDIK